MKGMMCNRWEITVRMLRYAIWYAMDTVSVLISPFDVPCSKLKVASYFKPADDYINAHENICKEWLTLDIQCI